MSTQIEEVCDSCMGTQEPLRLTHRFEPPYPSLGEYIFDIAVTQV
jgi:hypothetical protein